MFSKIDFKKFSELMEKKNIKVEGLNVMAHPFMDSGLGQLVRGYCCTCIGNINAACHNLPLEAELVASVVGSVVDWCGFVKFEEFKLEFMREFNSVVKKYKAMPGHYAGMELGDVLFTILTFYNLVAVGGKYHSCRIYKKGQLIYWDGDSEDLEEFEEYETPCLLKIGQRDVKVIELDSTEEPTRWECKYSDIVGDDISDYVERCYFCGEWFAHEDYQRRYTYIDSLGIICADCAASRGWHRCEGCGEWSDECNKYVGTCSDSYYYGDWLCDSCAEFDDLVRTTSGWDDYEEEEEKMPAGIKSRRKDYGSSSPVGIYSAGGEVIELNSHIDRITSQLFGVEIETIHCGKYCNVTELDKLASQFIRNIF
jgi:hypothetical protein